jgi:hypothetical protein
LAPPSPPDPISVSRTAPPGRTGGVFVLSKWCGCCAVASITHALAFVRQAQDIDNGMERVPMQASLD